MPSRVIVQLSERNSPESIYAGTAYATTDPALEQTAEVLPIEYDTDLVSAPDTSEPPKIVPVAVPNYMKFPSETETEESADLAPREPENDTDGLDIPEWVNGTPTERHDDQLVLSVQPESAPVAAPAQKETLSPLTPEEETLIASGKVGDLDPEVARLSESIVTETMQHPALAKLYSEQVQSRNAKAVESVRQARAITHADTETGLIQLDGELNVEVTRQAADLLDEFTVLLQTEEAHVADVERAGKADVAKLQTSHEHTIASIEEEIAKLQEALRVAREVMPVDVARLQRIKDQELALANGEMGKKLISKLADVDLRVRGAEANRDELLAEAAAEVEQLRAQADHKVEEVLVNEEQEVVGTEQDVTEWNAESAALRELLTDSQRHFLQLYNVGERLAEHQAETTTELTALEDGLALVEEERKDVRAELDELKEELKESQDRYPHAQAAYEAEMISIADEIDRLSEESRVASSKTIPLARRKLRLQESIQELEHIQEMEAQLDISDDSEDDNRRNTIESLQGLLANLDEENEPRAEEGVLEDAEIALTIKERIQKSTIELREVRALLKPLEEVHDNLQNELIRASTNRGEAENLARLELRELDGRIPELMQDIKERKKTNLRLSASIRRINEKKITIEGKLAVLQADISANDSAMEAERQNMRDIAVRSKVLTQTIQADIDGEKDLRTPSQFEIETLSMDDEDMAIESESVQPDFSSWIGNVGLNSGALL